MRKLIFMLVFAIVAMAASAQTRGRVITLQTDTLKGITGNPKSSSVITLTGAYNSLTITALYTQIGGTSDGDVAVYGSLDGVSYTFLNGVGGAVLASPKASNTGTDFNQLTIINGLVANWVIPNPAHRFYKLVYNGTATDTTKVVTKYVIK